MAMRDFPLHIMMGLPPEVAELIQTFIADSNVDKEAACVKLIKRLGYQKVGMGADWFQKHLVSMWSAITDLPFPYRLIDSNRLWTRFGNLAKMGTLLGESRLHVAANIGREQIGQVLMEVLTDAINGNQVNRNTTTNLSTATSERAVDSDAAPDSDTSPPAPEVVCNQNDCSSPKSNRGLNRRPFVKSGLCQERIFKLLSRDDRPIMKCGRPNATVESTDSFLRCTIVGFRGRECVFAEPVGTCGMYEEEGRFLIIDEKSNMMDSDGLSMMDSGSPSFIDLPVARDIAVYELERMSDGQNSTVMSLLGDKPVWRVKSFILMHTEQPGSRATVVVERQLPAEHAVTVNAVMFDRPHLVHMGSAELPEVDSILTFRLHIADFEATMYRYRGAVILVKRCSHHNCRCPQFPYHSLSQPEVMNRTDLRILNEYSLKHNGTTLQNFLRETSCSHTDKCMNCCERKSKEEKKSRCKGYSGRKSKKIREGNISGPFSQLKKRSRRNKYADGLHSSYSSEPEVGAALSENDTPPEVLKPDPIRCSLCLTDIQPMDEVYYKIYCLEDCHLSVHKKCMQEALAGQGLHKKKEYKDGFCPTEGCSSHIQRIYEYSLNDTESLYLKCMEKTKLEKKVENSPKKDKKKDHKTSISEDIVDHKLSPVRHDVQATREHVTAELPAEPPSPVVAAAQALPPPPRPNRCIPLPVHIENVVRLVREKDALEAKYAVSEQHQKKTKSPNKKKKNILNIEFGLRQEPMSKRGTPTGNQLVPDLDIKKVEAPAQREIGRGWSQCREKRNKGAPELAPQHHYGYYLNDCNICLEPVWKWEDVMWCPHCIEPYHSQCVRGWLYNNASCPQCRRNWPDPVEFPGLGEY